MSFEDGPHLELAALCERVIEDKSGVISLISITDRLLVTTSDPAAPEAMPAVPINLTAVVGFKAGTARGRHTLVIRPEAPSGLKLAEVRVPVFLEGEDRGSRVIFQLAFSAVEEGLYWFDVLLDDVRVTRMPLRLIYQRLQAG